MFYYDIHFPLKIFYLYLSLLKFLSTRATYKLLININFVPTTKPQFDFHKIRLYLKIIEPETLNTPKYIPSSIPTESTYLNMYP